MPARTPLDPTEIETALVGLGDWRLEETADGSNRIVREYRFPNFRAAMAFLVRIGFEAEALDHHPEITNVYDRVTLRLATHDAGDRVTEMDLTLAMQIDGTADESAR